MNRSPVGATAWVHAIARHARLPVIHDVDAMQSWIGVLRILVGGMAVVRTTLVADGSRFYFESGTGVTGWLPNVQTEFAILECALLLLLALGAFTPFVIAAILLTYPRFETLLGIQTLGTDILAIVLVFMLLADAGARYSVDSFLGARVRIFRRIHGMLGRPDASQLTVYVFGMFAAYALVNLRALGFHLQDPYWRSGDTVGVMFTSSYMSRVWEPLRQLEIAMTSTFQWASTASVVGQTIFQGLMLPLAFTRAGAVFVAVWGAMFIAASTLLLELSYLPLIEAALWLAIFARPRASAFGAPTGVRGKGRSRVVSDGAVAVLVVLAAAFLVRVPHLEGAFKTVGFDAPNVFNSTDLRMSESWWSATRQETGVTVPMYDEQGQRLRYFMSDVIYVGNSLPWRRAMIGRDLEEANGPGTRGRRSIIAALRYDRRRHGGADPWAYRVVLHSDRSADTSLAPDQRYEVTRKGAFIVVVSP